MGEVYRDKLLSLQKEILTGGASLARVDGILEDLTAQRDDRLSTDLLLLLSDQEGHDEAMFSLIHAAEDIDDNAYVRDLITVFPELTSSSPRWASIVLLRVLNNDCTRRELVRQLHGAEKSIKISIFYMCERINEVDPQFLVRTTPVMLAATE